MVGMRLTVQRSHSTAPQSASRVRRRPCTALLPAVRLVAQRSHVGRRMPWLEGRLRCRTMRRRWTMLLARREKKGSEALRGHKVRQAHDEGACPFAGGGPILRVVEVAGRPACGLHCLILLRVCAALLQICTPEVWFFSIANTCFSNVSSNRPVLSDLCNYRCSVHHAVLPSSHLPRDDF